MQYSLYTHHVVLQIFDWIKRNQEGNFIICLCSCIIHIHFKLSYEYSISNLTCAFPILGVQTIGLTQIYHLCQETVKKLCSACEFTFTKACLCLSIVSDVYYKCASVCVYLKPVIKTTTYYNIAYIFCILRITHCFYYSTAMTEMI